MATDGPNTFKIDQAATFEALMALSGGPKTAFGDQYRQEMTKDGLGKWELELAARFRVFGRSTNKIIKVGLVAESDPFAGVDFPAFVQLVDLEIGVMDKTNREGQPVGAQVWYRCAEVRALDASGGSARRGRGTEDAA